MKLAFVFAFIILVNLPLQAREIRMLEKYNVGGYIEIGPNKPYKFEAGANPLTLLKLQDLSSRGNAKAAKHAQSYVAEFSGTTGMLLIDRGKIVFESYQGMGSERSEFYGMSISKSMTSLAIGKALCNGDINNLDLRAGDLIPELKVNNYGHSTIRQILTMSSGAFMTIFGGRPNYKGGLGYNERTARPWGGPSWPVRLGQLTVDDLLWGEGWRRIIGKNHAAPGEVFLYRNNEPMVLSKIIEKTTGRSLAAYFDTHVWRKINAEHVAHWEADKDGTDLGYVGFQASLRDWGRIALWILAEIKKPGCFGDYLKTSTSTQIKTSGIGGTANTPFKGYGFQWWTDHKNAPGFWGKGFAGQELAINPKTGKVLIKFGYRTYPGVASGIVKLYRNWNKSN
jgi:CubicO group peptidase (beta-lactamase class C family)